MKLEGPVTRLSIFVGEDDRWHHRPLFTEIVHRAHQAGLAGASVLRGIEGYGASSRIHTTRLLSLSEDLPVLIVIVDTEEKIRGFLPQLDELVTEGFGDHRSRRGDPLRRPGGHVTVLLVALGAAVGAPMRYLTDRVIQARHDSLFPWGTCCVNVAGSFLAGALAAGLAAGGVSDEVMALAGVGFCGALTTYSTFGYETVRLIEDRAWFYAAANVTASVVAGLGAAFCGVAVAEATWA